MNNDRDISCFKPDRIELILGNTHRCGNCGQPIDLTVNSAKETREQCSDCGSFNFIRLSGLEECQPL